MDYSKLTTNDLENIIKEGLKSPFWGWLRYSISITKDRAFRKVVNVPKTLDQCIENVKWGSIYNQTEEILNFPQQVLKSLNVQEFHSVNSSDRKNIGDK